MSEQEFVKFKSTWPRVVRSPLVSDGQAIVMGGECFEDGLQRVVVGYGITPEQVAELTAAIEDSERVTRLAEAINRLLPSRTSGSRDE